MKPNRLEAFSDGVLAIIITVMVLELRASSLENYTDLKPLLPAIGSYILSFIYIGIYWNNHHHMFFLTKHVNGSIMWANLHLLFWLSLFPFTTACVGKNHYSSFCVALYGVVASMAACAYYILEKTIIASQGENSVLALALGPNRKGKLSIICYLLAIPLAYVNTWISIGLFITIAILWLAPDQRIKKVLS